jgi:predicted metal-dependent phosphoesterase TrpH
VAARIRQGRVTGGHPPARGGRIELHAHTHFSDGTLSPAELVTLAAERGLTALAITDHDSVEGVPHAFAAADALRTVRTGEDATLPEVVAGIEISSTLEGNDLHVLGYFLDWRSEVLGARLERFREERRARARQILQRLASLGVPVEEEEVFAAAGPGVVGRPHIANALLRAGHVPTIDVAFQRYLGTRGSAFVPRPAFPSGEAVRVIREAGGAAVLAHPAAITTRLVEQLAEAGLAGIEVWHPQHGMATQRRWYEVARTLGLVPSGGSDFHGPHRGVGLGEMPVPERALADLRARAKAA